MQLSGLSAVEDAIASAAPIQDTGHLLENLLVHMLPLAMQISSKQLRDDLMTMLIAGHETTAAVLTWTMFCLSKHPEYVQRIQAEVRIADSPRSGECVLVPARPLVPTNTVPACRHPKS